MQRIEESLIVGASFSSENEGVLVVGRQTNGKIDIINAFSGKDAMDLYKKLITVTKGLQK